jgi:hypothetical protein
MGNRTLYYAHGGTEIGAIVLINIIDKWEPRTVDAVAGYL